MLVCLRMVRDFMRYMEEHDIYSKELPSMLQKVKAEAGESCEEKESPVKKKAKRQSLISDTIKVQVDLPC